MPRMIKADCPECHKKDSLTIAFGEPYADFGDGMDDSDFRAEVFEQECNCHPDATAEIYDTIYQWNANCYPSAIAGEWHVSQMDYRRPSSKAVEV